MGKSDPNFLGFFTELHIFHSTITSCLNESHKYVVKRLNFFSAKEFDRSLFSNNSIAILEG